MVKKLYIKEDINEDKIKKELYRLENDLNNYSKDKYDQRFSIETDYKDINNFGIALYDQYNEDEIIITNIPIRYNDNSTFTFDIFIDYGPVQIHETKTYRSTSVYSDMDKVYYAILNIMRIVNREVV